MKQKALKILALLCAVALIMSVISVGFVANAAEASVTRQDFSCDADKSYTSVYGENKLAGATVSANATEIIDGVAKPAGSWTPGAGLTDNSTAAQQMIQVTWPSGAANAPTDYTSTNQYLDYTFSLASAVNNPEKVLLAFLQYGSEPNWSNTFLDSRHYAIYASSDKDSLFTSEPIFYSQENGSRGKEHLIDISGLELKNVKYLGVRVYNFYFWGNTVLFSEIGLYGGKTPFKANAQATSDDYATRFGDNWLTTSSYVSTESVDGVMGTPSSGASAIMVDNLWSTGRGMYQSANGMNASNNEDGQTDTFFQTTFTLAAPINNPETAFIAWANSNANDTVSQESHHYEIFASDSLDDLYTKSIYKHYTSSDLGWEHQIDISDQNLKNIKYFGIRIYHRTAALWNSIMVVTEIGLYGGTSILTDSATYSDDANNAYNYGANRLSGSTATTTTTIVGTDGNATMLKGADVGVLTDGSTASRNQIQVANVWNNNYSFSNASTDKYIQVTFALSGALKNPEKFLIAHDQASLESNPTVNQWYEIFASDTEADLYENSVFVYKNTSAKKVEQQIDLTGMDLGTVNYFGIRFYHTPTGCFALPSEIALYGGSSLLTTEAGLTSDSNGSYAAYGDNRLTSAIATYSLNDPENPNQEWSGANQNPVTNSSIKTGLVDNTSANPPHIQPAYGIGSVNNWTQTAEYIEFKYELKNYLSDPTKFMITGRNAGELSPHYAFFAATNEEDLFDAPVYEFSGSTAGVQEHHYDLSFFELKDIKFFAIRFYAPTPTSAYYLLNREVALYGGTEYSIVSSSSTLTDDANNNYNYGDNRLAGSEVTSKGMFEGGEVTVNGSNVVNGATLTDNSTTGGNLIWYNNSWNDSYSDNENTYIEITFSLARILNNPEKFLIAKDQAVYETASDRCFNNWYAIYASDSLDTLYDKPFYEYYDYSAKSVEDIIDISRFNLTGIKYFGIRIYDLAHNCLIRPSEIALYGGETEAAAAVKINTSSTAVNNKYTANHLTGLNGTSVRVYNNEVLATSTTSSSFNDLNDARGLTSGVANENPTFGEKTAYHQLSYALNYAVDNPDHLLISFAPLEGAQYSSQHYEVYMSSDEATLFDTPVYEYITKGGTGVGVEHEIDVSELELQDIKYVGIRFYHRCYGNGQYQFLTELGLFGGTTEGTFAYRDGHMHSFETAFGTNNLHWGGAEAVASNGTNTALTSSAPGSNLTDGNPATLTMITGSDTILTANNNDINQTSAYLQFSFDLLGTLNNPKHAAIAFHEGTSNGVSSQHYAIFAAASKSALYDEASKVYEYKSDAKQGVEHHIDLTKLGKDLTGIKFVGLRIYNRGYNNNVQHLSEFGVYGGTFTADAKINMTVNADFTDDDNNSYESIYGKNMLANGTLTYSHSSDLAYSTLPPKFDYLTDGSTAAWNQIQPTTGRIGHQGIYGQTISYLDIEFNLNSAVTNPEKFLISFGRADSLQNASQHYAVYFLAEGETVETTSKVYEYKSKIRENYEHIIPLSNVGNVKSVVVRFYESYDAWLLPSEIALYGGAFEMIINNSATMVDGSYASYGENMLKNASLSITANAKDLGDVSSANGNNNALPLTDGLGYDGTDNSRTYIENLTLKSSTDADGNKLYANDYTQTDNYIDLTFALNGVLNNPESFMMAWPSDTTQTKPSMHYVLYASDKLETLYQNPIRTYQNASRQGVEHIFDLSALNLTNVKYFGVRFYERMAWDLLLISEIGVYGGEYESALELAGSVIMGDEVELNNYDIQYRVSAENLTYKNISDMGMVAGFKFELQGRNDLDSIDKAKATELLKKNAAGSNKFFNSKMVGSEALYFHILNSGSKDVLDDRSGYAIYAIGYITFTDESGREISLWSNTMTKSSKQISRTQARDYYNMGGEYKEIADASYAGYDFTNASTDISKVRAYVMDCANLDPDMVTTTTQVVTDGVLSESFLEKGRTYVLDSALGLDNSAAGIEFNAYCRGDITIKVNGNGGTSNDNKGHKFVCVIDGVATYDLTVPAGSYEYDLTVATGVKQGNHTIGIYRMTPGMLDLISVTLKGEMLDAPERKSQTIAFVGDSITVGHYSVVTVTTSDGETITDYDGSKIKDLRVDIIDTAANLIEVANKDWGLIQFSGNNILVGSSTGNTAYSLAEYDYQVKFTDENGDTRTLPMNTAPGPFASNSYDDYAVKTAKLLGAEWDNIGLSGDKLENVVNSNKIFTQTYRDTSASYTPNADIYVIHMATNSIYSGSNTSNYGTAMENAVKKIREANSGARIVFVYGSMRNDEMSDYLDQTWTADANYNIFEHHENIRTKAAALKETYGDIYCYGFEHIKRQGGGGNHPSMAQQDEMAQELAAYLSTAFTDVYVDQTAGSDSNIGSESKPVKTLAKAAQIAGDEDAIKVIGTYTLAEGERIGVSNKAIKIVGADSNANITATTMVFSGETTIDNIKLNFNGNITYGTENVAGFVYGEYNKVTFGEGVTTTSTSGTVGIYAYAGKYDTTNWTDTNLTINGGTWYRVFGNSDKHNGVANNTYVTIGGNAVVQEVFGGGYFVTDSDVTYNSVGVSANVTINGGTICRVFGGGRGSVAYTKSTNVVINGGTYYEGTNEIGMSVFGGTTYGANATSTKVTLNDGVVNQIFGGNEGSSLSYSPPCSTEIYLLGGKITYRVYGGCYNYVSTGLFSITFETNNYVNGSTYVYVSDEVNMAFDDPTAESYMGYNDKSLAATSRVDLRKTTSAFVTGENATLEFESQAKYNEIKNGGHMGNSYTEGYNPYDTLIIAGVTQ